MNVLPFITVFLLVFALLASGLMTSTKTTLQKAKAHKNYMAAQRDARNKSEEMRFEIVKKRHPKKPSTHKNRKSKQPDYISPRMQAQYSNKAKINLFRIASEKQPPKTLVNAFNRILVELYGDTISNDELQNIHQKINKKGQALIKKALKKGEEIDSFILIDLLEVEDPINYKILRGTSYHDADKKIGLPPLGDFIYFENRTSPLYMNLASPTLLNLLFGREKSEKLLAIEQKNKKGLSLSEFQEVVKEKTFESALVNSSVKSPKAKQTYVIGESEKVRVKKNIY